MILTRTKKKRKKKKKKLNTLKKLTSVTLTWKIWTLTNWISMILMRRKKRKMRRKKKRNRKCGCEKRNSRTKSDPFSKGKESKGAKLRSNMRWRWTNLLPPKWRRGKNDLIREWSRSREQSIYSKEFAHCRQFVVVFVTRLRMKKNSRHSSWFFLEPFS